MHLLTHCPLYADEADDFLNSSAVRGDPSLLYGEVSSVRPVHRRLAILQLGAAFLEHVNATRVGGI